MKILVTGGAGFIDAALVRHLIANTAHEVLVLDALTYAGTLTALEPVAEDPRYRFVHADICDAAVRDAIAGFCPDVITHLAAESHVDRSINGPGAFIQTNLVGTYTMLAAALDHWQGWTRQGRGVSASTYLNRRSARLARGHRLLHRRMNQIDMSFCRHVYLTGCVR